MIDDEEELEQLPDKPEEKERDGLLVGYIWSKRRKKFVSIRTGKPISEAELQRLFKRHITDAEDRMSAIATAYQEGRIDPAVFVERMAAEQRRHTVQSVAMGKGGFDEMDAALLIGLALLLRETNQRIVGTAHDVLAGEVTLPQLLNRVEGYVGEGRRAYYEAARGNRATIGPTGDMVVLERRILHAKKSCDDCIRYQSQGWQLAGTLPIPSVACKCGNHCRCDLISMSVPSGDVQVWVGTKR